MSGYLKRFIMIESLRVIINRCAIILRKQKFDAIAFRGLSGALLAVPLALKLKKPIIAVRKEHSSHSETNVEGFVGAKRYVIVDDFIVSGKTCRQIVKAIKRINPKAKCIGVLEADLVWYSKSKEALESWKLRLDHTNK